MWKPRTIRPALGLLLLAALPACAPRTPGERLAVEQEVAMAVLWECQKDSRFDRVKVSCAEGVLTLEGRVGDPKAHEDAVRIAESRARGMRVVSRIEVRPR